MCPRLTFCVCVFVCKIETHSHCDSMVCKSVYGEKMWSFGGARDPISSVLDRGGQRQLEVREKSTS